jgi:hypothetical protein
MDFLYDKPLLRRSIMQMFDTSFQRLRNPDRLVTALLNLLKFLGLDDPEVDFRRFSFRREWLHECKTDPPDYSIFAAERSKLSALVE